LRVSPAGSGHRAGPRSAVGFPTWSTREEAARFGGKMPAGGRRDQIGAFWEAPSELLILDRTPVNEHLHESPQHDDSIVDDRIGTVEDIFIFFPYLSHPKP